MLHETETQTRLRRSKEALDMARAKENELRIALAEAVRITQKAKERHSELFHLNEKEECARKLATYNHYTK